MYHIRRPQHALRFTGERYTSEATGEIEHEHVHRYLIAAELAEGADVLDVACGEGYGSAILGRVAKTVVGVDADAETIDHCRANYAAANVTFLRADATSLPLPDEAVDVVVSFETLEHVQDHEAFLDEVERVMRDDGILILSTPNRLVYSADGQPNPFHVREFDQATLTELLRARFAFVEIAGQKSAAASAIDFPGEESDHRPLWLVRLDESRYERSVSIDNPTYFVAVASNRPMPFWQSSVLLDGMHLPDLHTAYRTEIERLWQIINENAEKSDGALREAQTTLQEALRASEGLTRRLEAAGAENERLRRDLDAVARERRALDERIEAILASTSWKLTKPVRWVRGISLRVGTAAAAELARARQRARGVARHAKNRIRLETAPQPDTGIGRPRPSHRPELTGLLAIPGDDAFPSDLGDAAIATDAVASADSLASIRSASALAYRPLVSVLLPTYQSSPELLRRAVASVLVQTYDHLELCIVDDGSSAASLHETLDVLSVGDPRIRLERRSANEGISTATNAALHMAVGEFVAMLDHDDELDPDALLEVVRVLNLLPETDVIYTDQDYIDVDGTPSGDLLKPDWSPTRFAGVMFVGHLLVVRRSLALDASGFDSAFDNVQDFEFMLRLSEQTNRIHHVPRVLYHWRRVPGSVAHSGDAKPEIEALQSRAVSRHLARIGADATAVPHPTHAHRAQLFPGSTLSDTTTTLLVVADELPSWVGRLMDDRDGRSSDMTYVQWHPSGLRSLHDVIAEIETDLVVFVNRGLTPVVGDWLSQLVMHARQVQVAIAGSVIVGKQGIVAEAGYRLGPPMGLTPAHRGSLVTEDGYAGSLSCAREVSAVSAGAIAIARETYLRLGGLDSLIVSPQYSWLDLSLRASGVGLSNIVTPLSRFRDDLQNQRDRDQALDRMLVHERWRDRLRSRDPYSPTNEGD